MKNTKLVWRLSDRPTPQSVIDLTNSGLITKEEAKEILFSLETDDTRDKKSLESEIKFLRDLVAKLSTPQVILQTIREVQKPYYQQPWYQPYISWTNAISGGFTGGTTFTSTTGSATALNASLNSQSQTLLSNQANFSDIKTF